MWSCRTPQAGAGRKWCRWPHGGSCESGWVSSNTQGRWDMPPCRAASPTARESRIVVRRGCGAGRSNVARIRSRVIRGWIRRFRRACWYVDRFETRRCGCGGRTGRGRGASPSRQRHHGTPVWHRKPLVASHQFKLGPWNGHTRIRVHRPHVALSRHHSHARGPGTAGVGRIWPAAHIGAGWLLLPRGYL